MRISLPSILIVMTVCFHNVALADLTLVQEVQQGDTPIKVTTKAKGSKVLTDTGMGIAMLVDESTGETITIMHPNKSIMRMTPEMMKQMRQMAGQTEAAESGTPSETQKLTATGRKQNVAGFECEEYLLNVPALTGGGIMEAKMWIAKNHPQTAEVNRIQKIMQKQAGTVTASALDLPGVPIRMEFKSPDGNTTSVTTVEINADPIADAAFELPANYQEATLPTMP